MRIGACQTQEILGDVDTAVAVALDFAARAEAAAVDASHGRAATNAATSEQYAVVPRIQPVRS